MSSGYEVPAGKGVTEEGRKEVPTEVANTIQKRLMELMTPESFDEYITGTENDPFLDALMERWAEKYVLGFNGFAEYCDAHGKDRAFMERAKTGKLSDEDYADIINFLENPLHGEPFFGSEEEMDAFLKQARTLH